MSKALWCDLGDHSFSENDPERTTVEIGQMVRNEWGSQQMHRVPRDVCGQHATGFNVAATTPAAIEAGVDEKFRQARTAQETAIAQAEHLSAEAEAEMWRAKYEAEVAKQPKAKYASKVLER